MRNEHSENMKILYLGMMTGNNGFTKAFKSLCDYREVPTRLRNFKEESIRVFKEFKPDMVFMQIQAANVIDVKTVQQFKGTYVVNWTGDIRSPIPPWYFEIGRHIDLTCFSNMTDVKEFRKSGLKSEFLDIGYDNEIYYPDNREKTKDIVFMGSNYGNKFPLSQLRRDMVNFLKNEYGDRFEYYGNGWLEANGSLNQHDEAEVYRNTKIAINLNHYDHEHYNSDRMFRILGCGTMCLPRYYQGIDEDYPELPSWVSFKDLKQQLDLFLEHPGGIVVMEGYSEELAEEHTFEEMCKNIIKLYKK